MEKFDVVYIVLVYKNYSDFLDFYKSVKKKTEKFKIIIINSYYDDKTKNEGIKISQDTDSDFISIDNKGYGYGNNVGIKYALKKYQFEFLIISNPDVEIVNLPLNQISKESISGPKIINKQGKNQNPHYFEKNKIPFYFMKEYAEKDNSLLLYMYLVTNKVFRNISKFKFRVKDLNEVFALHGSFMIFPYHLLKRMVPVFDDQIFLYTEENHVGEKAILKDIKLTYNPRLEVFHKEDGSSANVNTKKRTLESLKIYFKNWEK